MKNLIHKPQKNIFTKYLSDKGLYSNYTKKSGTASLKMYKSEHLAKGNIQIVNNHIKNTQNHISLGNYKLKQQWSSTAHLLDPVNSKGGGGHFSGDSGVKTLPDSARDLSLIPYPGRSHMPEKLSWIFPELNKAHLWPEHYTSSTW